VHPAIVGVVLILVAEAVALELLVQLQHLLLEKVVPAVQEKITVLFLDHL
jgi:hypothetical protein